MQAIDRRGEDGCSGARVAFAPARAEPTSTESTMAAGDEGIRRYATGRGWICEAAVVVPQARNARTTAQRSRKDTLRPVRGALHPRGDRGVASSTSDACSRITTFRPSRGRLAAVQAGQIGGAHV